MRPVPQAPVVDPSSGGSVGTVSRTGMELGNRPDVELDPRGRGFGGVSLRKRRDWGFPLEYGKVVSVGQCDTGGRGPVVIRWKTEMSKRTRSVKSGES